MRQFMQRSPRLAASVFGLLVAGILAIVTMAVVVPALRQGQVDRSDLEYEGTITTADGQKYSFVMEEGTGGAPEPEASPEKGAEPTASVTEDAPPTPPKEIKPTPIDGGDPKPAIIEPPAPKEDSTNESSLPDVEAPDEKVATAETVPSEKPASVAPVDPPVAGVMSHPKKDEDPKPRAGKPLKFYVYDKDLGYRHRPGVKARIRKKKKKTGETIFNVVYSTDPYRRRTTIPNNPNDKALLFLGCSYTFGWGVNDDETLPSQLAALMPGYQVFNYGQGGMGTSNVYQLMLSKDLHKQDVPKKAAMIYLFLHVHIRRTLGVKSVAESFGQYFPWYELKDGNPVRMGQFDDRPRMWPGDQKEMRRAKGTRNYYGEYLLQRDARLVGRLIEETKRLFESRFDSLGFFVVLFPERQGPLTDAVADHCRKAGIKVLDYRNLLRPIKDYDDYFIPHDGHPRPITHGRVAKQLRVDLRAQMLKK